MACVVGKQPRWDEPVLFVDFDDVVNVFGRYREYPGVMHAVVDTSNAGRSLAGSSETEIAWNQPIVSALSKMNAVWITSWKHLTQSVLNPVLDLDFGYLDWLYRGPSDYGAFGKSAGIIEAVMGNGCPAFAVVDDSMGRFASVFSNALPDVPHKIIAPKRDMGLTLPQIAELLQFLENGGK